LLKKPSKNSLRKKRHMRLRNKISGSAERPRLNVYRSSSHIYAQVIDDTKGITLVSASSMEEAIKEQVKSTGSKEAAALVGKMVGDRAKEKGIESITFDRGGYIYHGRVKALAEGVREAGLKF
jgi:large subunit ribosomal protein L18